MQLLSITCLFIKKWWDKCSNFLQYLMMRVKEFEKNFTTSSVFQNSFMVEIFSEFPQLSSFRINAPLLFVTLQSWKNPNSWHLSIGCHNTWIMIWYYQWGPDPTKYLHKRGKLAPYWRSWKKVASIPYSNVRMLIWGYI